jgi:putative ABC transport system permease protein
VVSQTIFANTMENIEEYATLKALGASRGFVARVVIMESLICGAGGTILGLVAVIPAMRYAKSLIPWIHTPWWLPMMVMVLSLLMCSLASIASIRNSLSVDPGRVFRA